MTLSLSIGGSSGSRRGSGDVTIVVDEIRRPNESSNKVDDEVKSN